jgi:uncharacterized protein DUF6636
MKRFAISLVVGTAALAILAPSASAKLTFFQSPRGNISCLITGRGVRCDIRNHQWPTPPKPADCDVDYGGGVAVGRRDVPANFVCAGDTVFDPNAEVLGYGQKIKVKRFRCASKPKGMRCVNRSTKHGFFLSAQDVRLF